MIITNVTCDGCAAVDTQRIETEQAIQRGAYGPLRLALDVPLSSGWTWDGTRLLCSSCSERKRCREGQAELDALRGRGR